MIIYSPFSDVAALQELMIPLVLVEVVVLQHEVVLVQDDDART